MLATFETLRNHLPRWMTDPIRSVGTAVITPLLFSYRTGHFRSSLRNAAVSKEGAPLPWYTYPSIDFLKARTYEDKIVLEFGGGQSTLWWAERARHVVTFEGDKEWFSSLKSKIPPNVDLHLASMQNPSECVKSVVDVLHAKPFATYDVIVIDGLYRRALVAVARNVMADTGMIVCDNAEGYGFQEALKHSEFLRVDFFGNAPGVMRPHATSIFFKPSAWAFQARHPIPVSPYK
jgi:hypothetical protein